MEWVAARSVVGARFTLSLRSQISFVELTLPTDKQPILKKEINRKHRCHIQPIAVTTTKALGRYLRPIDHSKDPVFSIVTDRVCDQSAIVKQAPQQAVATLGSISTSL